ncbi:Tll0287-like domain-containing protein [Thalassolituus oleivorans]|uniref:Tll0287-like domain-containing protein n=1 Tax=Thalassolituus oleivorans MIL-1 TaxID=1298593 RepID=M5DWU3_9GAMM|nr:DUF3365 domain-containing protein [Thalassolituus oleivorans]APR68474.1 glutamate synthase [Thalassolituus oleivorans]CCU73799.1 hypothetical protein TOL_3409 [Thalassolituus oleivorans MIL-1]
MRKLVIMYLCFFGVSLHAGDIESLTLEARSQSKMLGQSLMAVLKTSLQNDGPEAAITVCNLNAPDIAGSLSQGDWRVGRTSLKIRNSDNAPDAWEKQTLNEFNDRIQAGENPMMVEASTVIDGEFRYMKAIPTAEMCVTCHGSNVAASVASKIHELYPADQAVGFNVGDLRGAFTLRKTLQE